MTANDSAREFLRAAEVANDPRFCLFGRTYWLTLITQGVIPSRKIGGARVVKASDLTAFLDGRPTGEVAR